MIHDQSIILDAIKSFDDMYNPEQNTINKAYRWVHPDNCPCNGCQPAPPKTLSPFAMMFGGNTQESREAYQASADIFSAGGGWSVLGEELLALEESVGKEYLATRVEREAERAKAIEEYTRKNKVERVAIREGAMRTRNGPVEIRRLAQPCKFLYNCQGTPARPTTMHITTECWSHEKGVCPWAHPAMPARAAMKLADGSVVPAAPAIPADPLWCPQWATDRLFRPVTAENRFAGLAKSHDHQHEERRERKRPY
jgi:hypothetical protein